MRRWRLLHASLLAALLAFHLAAVTLRALPAPDGALDRAAWADPTVQEELEAWRARLGRLGLQLDKKRFADGLYAFARRAIVLRNRVVAPFEKYYAYCGTFQSWQMFVAPHRHPARLRIELERGGQWRTLFREGDANARWLGDALGDTRFRSLLFRYGWPAYRGQLEQFADWVARRAAKDFPDAQAIRVIFSRAESPSPEQVLEGKEPPSTDDPPLVRDLARFRGVKR